MANYSAQFIHSYASLAAPLRELTRKNARCVWTARHKESFCAIKEKLRTTALLNYYDPNLKTELICDGSPVHWFTLAIQYGCLRNEIYLLGRDFDVISDHKPLVALYNNPRRPGPFRVERMRLNLQGFSLRAKYRMAN